MATWEKNYLSTNQLEQMGLQLNTRWLLAVSEKGMIDPVALECYCITCVLDEIQSGDLYLENSYLFNNIQDDFVRGADLKVALDELKKHVRYSLEPREFVAGLKGSIRKKAEQLDTAIPENQFIVIQENGFRLKKEPGLEASEKELSFLKKLTNQFEKSL